MTNKTCSVPGCDRNWFCRDWCSTHYYRVLAHGVPEPVRPTPEQRFWSKVQRAALDDCWLWTAARNPHGYGRVQINGSFHQAHRISYELTVGPIPDGLSLDHLCRVRNCVNPAHLEPVTNRVNGLRGVSPAAINAAKAECVNGHAFDEANTRVTAGPHGPKRQCRACDAEYHRRRRAALGSAA
jgi:hypothetical protein